MSTVKSARELTQRSAVSSRVGFIILLFVFPKFAEREVKSAMAQSKARRKPGRRAGEPRNESSAARGARRAWPPWQCAARCGECQEEWLHKSGSVAPPDGEGKASLSQSLWPGARDSH